MMVAIAAEITLTHYTAIYAIVSLIQYKVVVMKQVCIKMEFVIPAITKLIAIGMVETAVQGQQIQVPKAKVVYLEAISFNL